MTKQGGLHRMQKQPQSKRIIAAALFFLLEVPSSRSQERWQLVCRPTGKVPVEPPADTFVSDLNAFPIDSAVSPDGCYLHSILWSCLQPEWKAAVCFVCVHPKGRETWGSPTKRTFQIWRLDVLKCGDATCPSKAASCDALKGGSSLGPAIQRFVVIASGQATKRLVSTTR